MDKTLANTSTESRQQTTLLDGVIARNRFTDQIEVTVMAAPAFIFRAFDEVMPSDMPVAALIGFIRYLPARLLGKGQPAPPTSQSFIQGIKSAGWVTLAEAPDSELVFGGAGKYHQFVDQEPACFSDRADFFTFSDPSYQKLAISVRVEPGAKSGENRLIMEHRTQPLSEHSRRQFARYWLVIKPMGAFVSRQLLLAVKKRAERSAREAVN